MVNNFIKKICPTIFYLFFFPSILYPTCGICGAVGLFVCGKSMLICTLVLVLVNSKVAFVCFLQLFPYVGKSGLVLFVKPLVNIIFVIICKDFITVIFYASSVDRPVSIYIRSSIILPVAIWTNIITSSFIQIIFFC